MRIPEWTRWCLSGLLLLSSVAWAQDRGTGREAVAGRPSVGDREAMHDRARAIRLSQSNRTRSLLALRNHLEKANQTIFEGDNYVNMIPFVTSENGARTNIGINNFSQFSVFKGTNPEASVAVGLYDQFGNLDRSDVFRVRSNQMLQINQVMTALSPISGRGTATTGWLLIFSDEPITAWASVILDRVNNDPAIELAIADQVFKPSAFVESQGTPSNPLIIQSSVKLGTFKSRLAVVNIGDGEGRVRVNLFDRAGALQQTLPPVDVPADGMFVSDDIRSTVPGTFGQITIEVEDLNSADGDIPRIIATSLVESTSGPFAGFFPAFALPQPTTPAIAGVWEGSVTGAIMNARVRMALFQERDMLYGTFDILSGAFPTIDRQFFIRGEVVNENYVLEIRDLFDACNAEGDPCVFFAYRLFAPPINGNTMSGDTIYFDESDQSDKGSFNLTRVGAIYPD